MDWILWALVVVVAIFGWLISSGHFGSMPRPVVDEPSAYIPIGDEDLTVESLRLIRFSRVGRQGYERAEVDAMMNLLIRGFEAGNLPVVDYIRSVKFSPARRSGYSTQDVDLVLEKLAVQLGGELTVASQDIVGQKDIANQISVNEDLVNTSEPPPNIYDSSFDVSRFTSGVADPVPDVAESLSKLAALSFDMPPLSPHVSDLSSYISDPISNVSDPSPKGLDGVSNPSVVPADSAQKSDGAFVSFDDWLAGKSRYSV